MFSYLMIQFPVVENERRGCNIFGVDLGEGNIHRSMHLSVDYEFVHAVQISEYFYSTAGSA